MGERDAEDSTAESSGAHFLLAEPAWRMFGAPTHPNAGGVSMTTTTLFPVATRLTLFSVASLSRVDGAEAPYNPLTEEKP